MGGVVSIYCGLQFWMELVIMSSELFPAQILIIRHGEKPGDPGTDNSADGPDLSTRGYERAGALAPYIPATFTKPDFLFATQASANSNRPVETITPLALAINVSINSDYDEKHYAKLASDILKSEQYAGKTLLICWHHGTIPDLTKALLGKPPADKWPSTVFDRVWQIAYPTANGKSKDLPVTNIPQKLLYGDQDQ